MQLVKVATPAVTVTAEQFVKLPPEALKVMVPVQWLSKPDEVYAFTTGCVDSSEPDAAAAGWVEKTR